MVVNSNQSLYIRSSLLLLYYVIWVNAGSVQVIQSQKNPEQHWHKMPDVPFNSQIDNSLPLLIYNSSSTFQQIEGFGGAITDSVSTFFSLYH